MGQDISEEEDRVPGLIRERKKGAGTQNTETERFVYEQEAI